MKGASVLTLAFAIMGLTGSLSAADLTGTWKSTITLNGKSLETTLQLRLDSEGPTLTGFANDGASNHQLPISKASVRGTKVRFVVNHDLAGEPVAVNYQGTISGDTITGKATIEFGDRGQLGTWVAKRETTTGRR